MHQVHRVTSVHVLLRAFKTGSINLTRMKRGTNAFTECELVDSETLICKVSDPHISVKAN